MSLELSRTLSAIPSSSTLAISAKAKALIKEGHDVVDFGVGEPDFDTPANICEAGIKAIRTGQTRYTPASGTVELRQAVVAKMKRDAGIEYTADNVIISSGAKSSVYIALRALTNPGDEVIIPAPYWLSYPEMVNACEAKPVIVNTTEDSGFKLTPAALKAAITPRTKAIIFNDPSNPTGAVYAKQEIEGVGRVLEEAGIYVIADEIYEKLVYGDARHFCILSVCPRLIDRTIYIAGPAKTYAMTGWRMGFAVGPKPVVSVMTRFQSHVAGNPCTISQFASVEALSGDQAEVEKMRRTFDERRRFIVERIKTIPGVSLHEPKGAFYAFINISAAMKKLGIAGSEEFAMKFLDQKKVAAVGGAAFGAEGFIRFSYATSLEAIKKGMDRLEEFVKGM